MNCFAGGSLFCYNEHKKSNRKYILLQGWASHDEKNLTHYCSAPVNCGSRLHSLRLCAPGAVFSVEQRRNVLVIRLLCAAGDSVFYRAVYKEIVPCDPKKKFAFSTFHRNVIINLNSYRIGRSMKVTRTKNTLFLKVITVVLTVLLSVQLSACLPGRLFFAFPQDVPETVSAEGKTYRTGFYSDELWPVNLEYTDKEYEINNDTLYLVDINGFECLHAPETGGRTNGTLYCLDSQWEEAKAYYADPANFTYYCEVTPDWIAGTERAEIYPIDDMNPEMFEALMSQIDGTRNDPFDALERMVGENRESDAIDISNRKIYKLFFYRQSNDNHFVTFQGDHFSLIDGKLYFIRYRDGKDDTLHVIEITGEPADYFMNLLNGLNSPYLTKANSP